jgi:hypothetical protein
MEEANTAGTLKFLTNGTMNGQRVICTATEVNGACKNLLITLRPQDNGTQFLEELKNIFNGRSMGSIPHGSAEHQRYIEVDWKNLWNKSAKIK